MARYVLRRIPSAIVVLIVASMVIFGLLRLVPGDPAATLAGANATPKSVALIHKQLGLDHSLVSQYLTWIGHMVTLNFGKSYVVGGSVSSLISASLVNTLMLGGTALIVGVLIAFAASLAAVIVDRSWLNAIVTAGSTGAIGIPTFVTGTAFVLIFAVELLWLPAGGIPPHGFFNDFGESFKYLVLPVSCLALPLAAVLTRFLSESLRSQMGQPYVTTARALGIPRRRIVFSQALRNALPTTITVLGIQVGALLGGTILVESIFAWPGLGHLLQQAILDRDYPLVQVLLLFAVVVFVVIQLLTDLFHAYLDPRIRLSGAS
jgi:peptide/nickel transport system permease protein